MFRIFNPTGSDLKQNRSVFYGNTTGIINLNNVKYQWAVDLWRQMREQFWIAEKIDLSLDVTDYKNLTPSEQRAFDGILAYLVFLDSVQVQNIPHLVRPCSAPEISICFSEQLSQESLHSQSYQYMIESIIPPEKRESIYSYWKDDQILFERCKIIGNYYQQYIDDPTREKHLKALIADYILEGLYFYVGFIFFYNLASRSLMCGSADIFKLINRDELSHVRLYQKLIIDQLENAGIVLQGLGEVFAREMMIEAVNQEIKWSLHIIGDDILGMPPKAIEDYIKYLANIRLRAIGLPEIYSDTRNPFKHLEKIADISKHATTKVNFFDSTVSSYQMSTVLEEWDF
jgi:ribonucleoside-diphosphate reductase beta chain